MPSNFAFEGIIVNGDAGELVAEAGADGDLMTALGAAAIKNGGARLRLHAGKEAVGLGAVAAVRLKGTLRHEKTPTAEAASAQTF
jgi:hypothetical protein